MTQRERVLDAIRAAPMTPHEIVDLLYGAREDGGPENAITRVYLIITELRKEGHRIERRSTYGVPSRR